MNANHLTPAEITASRDRLLAEGFHPTSKAVRIHDELLAARRELDALRTANERNVEGAWQSMEALKAECERWEWNPIASAPKDGTRVLILDRSNEASRAYWDATHEFWQTFHGAYAEESELVAWLPCPPIPSLAATAESVVP